jgi:hypothetical protein
MTIPPPAGELAAASLLAFARYPDGALRGGVIYHCLPREKFDVALKLGWLPLGPCGVRDGMTIDLFAWMCRCKMVSPEPPKPERPPA